MKILIKMNKELIYLTYQTFPSEAANTIQTIDNVKYFNKKNYKVKLIFPLRSKTSTDNVSLLKKYYGFDDEIIFEGVKHNLPFGKLKFFEKYLFLISHYLWSRKISKNFSVKNNKEVQFFTRSDWIFYYLSRKGLNIIFECHQLSKTRKWVLRNSIHEAGAKVIFLNKNLLFDSGIDKDLYSEKIEVIPNGVDEGLFSKINNKKDYEIVFSGNLKRFDEGRGLEFVINAFSNKNMPKEYTLKVIGGPASEVNKLKEYASKLGLNNKIEFLDRLDRNSTISNIEKASIGLLINSSENLHSVKYSSPLKYFEYMYAGLKIIAINFPSHKILPFAENILFFNENDENSFINAIKDSRVLEPMNKKYLKNITMDARVNKIISLINK
tara:strand:- start:555 stop:1700 length:1146 start_codon:yes stop_codon:yes gene_type:complete